MPVKKICQLCGKEFDVLPARKDSAKYCSRECADHPSVKHAAPNTECSFCGKMFHMKESQKRRYKRTLGFYCSLACSGSSRIEAYAGSRNPNFKNRNVDHDGYRLYVPVAHKTLTGGRRMKLHTAICLEVAGLKNIPKGFHIHHRDCDILNNAPENLAVLSASDHKWLHKQFGNATLWAFTHGKVALEDLVSWSDDPSRAEILLLQSIGIQTDIRIFTGMTIEKVATVRPVRVVFEVEEV